MKKLTPGNLTVAASTTKGLAVLMGLAIALSACDGGSGSPTSPTSTTAAPPAALTFTLSGAVTEMTATGPTPVGGARIVDTSSGLSAVTNFSGSYSMPGLSATSHALSVSKDGYVPETMTVTLTADTQLDIRLDRVVSYILSGVVYEMTVAGQAPIEGVEIYCDSCGSPMGHTFVHTDSAGFYSLAWAMNGVHPLFVTKAGYEIVDPTGTLRDSIGRIKATVRGDTRFDIELVRR